MANGLMLGIKEFRSLPSPKKLDCLYENQVASLKIIGKYRLHQKIQYPWLIALSTGIIFLIKYAVTI